jgi:hypothetical protein
LKEQIVNGFDRYAERAENPSFPGSKRKIHFHISQAKTALHLSHITLP